MISEKVFIKNYPGFWNSLFPLQNTFLRGVTLDCSRHQLEIELHTSGRRFSFVSEVGFQLFAQCRSKKSSIDDIGYGNDLYEFIENQCRNKFELFHDDDLTIRNPLSIDEYSDAIKVAKLLNNKFRINGVIVNPKFLGCSIVDACYGDVLVDSTLYEIKTVSRNFNIMDFRQLITYCTLNYISKSFHINSIGLYNPKKDLSYEISLDMFASAIAGVSIYEIYWSVINFISGNDSSK